MIEKVMPADGMSAAAEKGTSARPVGQLGVRLPYSCKWRKWLCRLVALSRHALVFLQCQLLGGKRHRLRYLLHRRIYESSSAKRHLVGFRVASRRALPVGPSAAKAGRTEGKTWLPGPTERSVPNDRRR